ncbi:MAG: hypothetical protein ABIF40_00555 [archaeon]
MKKSNLIFLLMFLLCLYLVSAEEDCVCENDLVDYEKDDYTLIWGWVDIEWCCIPAERIDDVPVEHLEYEEINSKQRLRMTSEQIAANLDSIDNLFTDVDILRATKAIEDTYDIEMTYVTSISSDSSINFSLKNGIFRSEAGYKNYVEMSSLANLEDVDLTILNSGEVIVKAEKIEKIPEGIYTLRAYRQEISLDDGTVLNINGPLSYNKGEFRVISDNTVTINGVEVTAWGYGGSVDLYFDGKEHLGDYVSFDFDNQKIFMEKASEQIGSLDFKFNPETGIFDIGENDYLEFSLIKDTFVEIDSRSGEGLIPVITTRNGNEGLNLEIINGNRIFRVNDGNKFDYFQDYDVSNLDVQEAAPFTLFLTDTNDENVLGKASPQKIIFDEQGNYVFVSESLDSWDVECLDCVTDFKTNDALLYYYDLNFLEETSLEEYSNIDNSIILSELLYDLEQLPPEVANSMTKFDFYSKAQVSNICGGGKEAIVGCAYSNSRAIVLQEEYTKDVLRHEASHTLTYALKNDENKVVQGLVTYQLALKNKYNLDFKPHVYFYDKEMDFVEPTGPYINLEIIGSPDFTEVEEKILVDLFVLKAEVESASFKQKWQTIAGDVYGKDIVETEKGYTQWSDSVYGPRNGCVRSYGCKNLGEDIATFFENFAKDDYEFYQNLVNPTSPDYDVRYEYKLDLGYEYGFVTQEEYNKIYSAIIEDTN